MEAKLIKQGDSHYTLHMVGDSLGLIPSAVYPWDITKGRLSLKNCQAIERGYDLDELAFLSIEHIVNRYGERNTSRVSELDQERGFKRGFQKALEILGDKKFSEEDVKIAIEMSKRGSIQEQHNGYGQPTGSQFVLDKLSSDEIIQSIKQTEWDVIVMTKKVIDETKIVGSVKGVKGSGNKINTYKSVLKLDVDGCLILKRI